MRTGNNRTTSRSVMLRQLVLGCTLLAATFAWVTRTHAVTSLTGKQFLYWSNGIDTTAQFADHVSVVVIDTPNHVQRLQTLPAGMKAVVPVVLTDVNTGHCSLLPNAANMWRDGLAQELTPHLDKIAAILINDEPDNRAIEGCLNLGATYLQRQTAMAGLLDQMSSIVKYTVPGWDGVNTWVNYGTEFRNAGVSLAQHVDWNSFDCYGPFDNCSVPASGPRFSIPQLVDIMASKLPDALNQEMFLVSDASCNLYDVTGRKTHESELFIRGLEYWQLAATHPRLKGMVGFLWEWGVPCGTLPPTDSVNDVNDSPGLSTLYRHIGLNLLTGAVPSISILSVPAECVIPVGANTCTINLSWNTTSGPNLRLYGRLVGNFDVVNGPFCPGATACSIPAGAGDYIFELREFESVDAKLIYAAQTEVGYPNSQSTGQITFTPWVCKQVGGHCLTAVTANVQDAPDAGLFAAGATGALCSAGRTTFCSLDAGAIPVGGPYTFTVQLRANAAIPNSQILDQRTFSMTVIP